MSFCVCCREKSLQLQAPTAQLMRCVARQLSRAHLPPASMGGLCAEHHEQGQCKACELHASKGKVRRDSPKGRLGGTRRRVFAADLRSRVT